jgi:hypothetical protein
MALSLAVFVGAVAREGVGKIRQDFRVRIISK